MFRQLFWLWIIGHWFMNVAYARQFDGKTRKIVVKTATEIAMNEKKHLK